MSNDLLKAMGVFVEHIKKQKELPPDTARDGVYFIDTDEVSWVEIIHNGIHSKMSCDLYNTMINHPKIKEIYDERHKRNAK